MQDTEPVMQMLESVLEPLGDRRAEILDYARAYIQRSPILTAVSDEDGNFFGIGQDDPLAPVEVKSETGEVVQQAEPRKIFAMFEDWQTRTVVVHSFSSLEVQGQAAVMFHRVTVYKPKHVVTVVLHDALYNELRGYLAGIEPGDDEPEAAQTNGASH